MRLALAGMVIAGVGVGIAFALGTSYESGNPLAYVAFGMGIVGVGLGFIAIPWGWYRILKPRSKE